MTRQLRSNLLLLVVLNLLFVQITGEVSATWLVPLLSVTLAAPVLWPLQRFLWYRIAWNIALMGIFSLLLVHTARNGIRYLLEDGLILAAFCQVHVLNNLAKQKRPDLVFFNSFLIALVTGFFCQDLVYSGVFLVYAVVLIHGLGLAAASQGADGTHHSLDRTAMRALFRRSLRQSLAVLLVTGLVFMFMPRDFNREGLIQEQLAQAVAQNQVGNSDEIRLDNRGKVLLSNKVAMRVRILEGERSDIPTYWRGATFSNLLRRSWWADTNPQGSGFLNARQLDLPWERHSSGHFERPGQRQGARVGIALLDRKAKSLFTPMGSREIRFGCTAWPQVDGTFRITGDRRGDLEYELWLLPKGRRLPVIRGDLSSFTRIKRRYLPDEAEDLHKQVEELIPRGADQRTTVRILAEYLRSNRTYYLPGQEGAARNIQDFLADRGGGHCEFFATSMVMLLRLRGIPCRMVGGYLGHEWSEDDKELIIRERHAHAWVEVWDPKQGWMTIDPTPAQDDMRVRGTTALSKVQEWLQDMWASVATFDGKTRARLMTWVQNSLWELLITMRAHPLGSFMVLAWLVLGLWWWRRRQRPLVPAAVHDYRTVLHKLGLQLEPGETPRQLLLRAEPVLTREEHRQLLGEATRLHEARRYTTPT